MMEYRTVKAPSEAEAVINRSRFIGRCFPVSTEDEALSILADIRRKHWDATHNCFAYRIGETASCARFSDDGEPGGTAGMPIMEVLRARELTNALCVVTRYFGGILLGAGGLVRAYSKSAADCIASAGILIFRPAVRFELTMDYSRYGALEGLVRSMAQLEDTAFADNVKLCALVAALDADAFTKAVIERSDGRCTPAAIGEGYIKIDG